MTPSGNPYIQMRPHGLRTVALDAAKAAMRKAPTAIEAGALAHAYVFINAGQRGLQVKLNPQDAVKALDAKIAALTAQSGDPT